MVGVVSALSCEDYLYVMGVEFSSFYYLFLVYSCADDSSSYSAFFRHFYAFSICSGLKSHEYSTTTKSLTFASAVRHLYMLVRGLAAAHALSLSFFSLLVTFLIFSCA